MRKPVWKKVLWISIAVIACLGIGGYFAMDLAVNFALKQLASSVELEIELPKEPQQVAGNDPVGTPEELELEDQDESSESGQEPKDQNGSEEQADLKSPAEVQKETGSTSGKKEVAEEPVQEQERPKGDVSGDYVEQVKEQVSAGEKVKVASTLLKHFSMAELQEFAAIASDGITTEEKRAAREEFLNRLSEEEYNALIAIAAKYGLSQGRTYQEVKKEGSGE